MFDLSKLTDNQIDKAIKLTTILIIGCIASFAIYYGYSSYFAKSPTVTQKAIIETEKQVEKHPDNANLRVRLADLYLINKNYDEAMQQYEYALDINKNLGAALTGLGMGYLAKNENAKAIQYFNKEISIAKKGEFAHIDDNLEKAYFYSGMVYLTEKDYPKAISSYKNALKIKKTASDNNFYLGVALFEDGKKKEAVTYFKNTLMFEPKFAEAHYYLGKCAEASGNIKEAKKQYQEAVNDAPGYADAKKALEAL